MIFSSEVISVHCTAYRFQLVASVMCVHSNVSASIRSCSCYPRNEGLVAIWTRGPSPIETKGLEWNVVSPVVTEKMAFCLVTGMAFFYPFLNVHAPMHVYTNTKDKKKNSLVIGMVCFLPFSECARMSLN